jgi:hypothetical protein
VLISFFHTDHLEFSVTSEVMPGVERSFTSFPAAAEEATLSRIFAGMHFLFDLTTGQRLGSDIADFIVDDMRKWGRVLPVAAGISAVLMIAAHGASLEDGKAVFARLIRDANRERKTGFYRFRR